MARTRIEPGADERAARALRHGATGLSIAVVLLLLMALHDPLGTWSRLGAALGLAAYAWAVTSVALPVGRAVRRAGPTAARPLVLGVCVWAPVAAWADVVVVAGGAWRWLDAVGAIALTGVLAQAIVAALVYLTPMLRGRSTRAREVLRVRLERGMRLRAGAISVGVVAVSIAATRTVETTVLASAGWTLFAGALSVTLLTALWPIPELPQDATAQTARIDRIDARS